MTTIITRPFQSALELAQSSGAAPEVIEAMTKTRDMFVKRQEFTLEATTDDSETCQNVRKQTAARDWQADSDQGKTNSVVLKPTMYCGPLEGQFLKSLVSMQKARRILEVGMFSGYSALSMAEALPADGELVTVDICEMLKPLVEQWNETSPHAKKIKIRIGDGIEEVKKMAEAGEQFDMAFLDGDKAEYVELLKILFDQNVISPGGTVVVDNAYYIGTAYIPSADNSMAREMVDTLKGRPDLHSVLVPMSDGVLMVRRFADVEGETV